VDGQVRVVDLGSTNGTRVNGNPVRQQVVRAGDRVTFGAVTVELLPADAGG
jgi:pSer/pThr/pTyr-binding forkhead associated (FHA) protein